MKNFITYSLVFLMSLMASQTLFSNNLENKTSEQKVVTSKFIETVYPNPAYKGNTIYISLQLEKAALVNLVVLDMIGNKLIDNVISGESKHVQRLIIR